MKIQHFYILLIALFLSGCYGRGVLVIPAETHQHSSHTTTIVTHQNDHLLPPHAPRHGHRHRHHNHDLRYDTGFDAYVVINMPGLYFYDDHYIRYYNDSWQITNRLNGNWRSARQNDIPRKLKKARRYDKKQRSDHRDEPRHGHRRHHHNHDLSFDSRLDAYVVINMPGLYFYDDHYIRYYNNSWQITNRLNGNWRPARQNDIPRKLKKSRRYDKKHRNEHPRDRNEHRDDRRRDYYDEPEHGHRRHLHDQDLSYDSRLGAYVIIKKPGIFFYNNRYIRQHRGKWQTSNKLNGRWRAAEEQQIPKKLKSSKRVKKVKQSRKEESREKSWKKSREESYENPKETSKERYKEKWQ